MSLNATETSSRSNTETSSHNAHDRSDTLLDTGFTGRPRRGRYSKAAMMSDIVSCADPRLWPIYVAAVIIVGIPVFVSVHTLLAEPAAVLMADVDPTAFSTLQTPEETMAGVAPASINNVGQPLRRQEPAHQPPNHRVAVFGSTEGIKLSVASATATPEAGRQDGVKK